MAIQAQGAAGCAQPAFRFNFAPVAYCHPSWWETGGLPFHVFRRLVKDPASAPLLSRHMLRVHRIDQQFDFDFARPWKRVAFLSYPQQRRVMLQLGMVVYRARLARFITSAQQAELLATFGRDDYALALRAGLGGNHENLDSAYLPALPVGNRLRCRLFVRSAGMALLMHVLAAEPVGFKKRFYFTWPKPLVIKRLAARQRAAQLATHELARLEDQALYCCRLLNVPALVAEARRLLGQLLALQGY